MLKPRNNYFSVFCLLLGALVLGLSASAQTEKDWNVLSPENKVQASPESDRKEIKRRRVLITQKLLIKKAPMINDAEVGFQFALQQKRESQTQDLINDIEALVKREGQV